jgi:hypothetical protein
VAKALRTLQTGGLALSANIKAKDMNTVYSYALSGLSSEALTIACKKLVRGEYDIERKSFIPLPPELAAMVRAEQRLISDDLARARATLDSLQPAPVVERSPEAQARVKALRLGFLNEVQEQKERNGLAPTPDEFNEEKGLFGFRCGNDIMIKSLLSVETPMAVSAQGEAVARVLPFQLAWSNVVGLKKDGLWKHTEAALADHQRHTGDALLEQGFRSQPREVVPTASPVEVLHQPVSALGVGIRERVVEVVEHLKPLVLDCCRQLVEFQLDAGWDVRPPLVEQPFGIRTRRCFPDGVEGLFGLPAVLQQRVVVEQSVQHHAAEGRELRGRDVHDGATLVRVPFQRTLGGFAEPTANRVQRHVGLAENMPLVGDNNGVRQEFVDHVGIRSPHVGGDDPHSIAVRHPGYPAVNGRLQHGVDHVDERSVRDINEHRPLLLANGQLVDTQDDDGLRQVAPDSETNLFLADVPHRLVVDVHVSGDRAVALHHALFDDVVHEATGHSTLAVHGRKLLHRRRAAVPTLVSGDLGSNDQRLSERRNVLVIHDLGAVPVQPIDRSALRAVSRIGIVRGDGDRFVFLAFKRFHGPPIQPDCIVRHVRPSFEASHTGNGLSCGVSCRAPHSVDRPRHRNQQVSKLRRRCVALFGLVLAPDHGDDTDASSFLVAIPIDHPLRQALAGWSELQVRLLHAGYVEPCRLSGSVTVVSLLDITRPAVVHVGTLPTHVPLRWSEPEACPGATVGRVLQNPTETPHRGQSVCETAVVIAELILVRLASAAVPESAPPLAGRVGNHRVWTEVFACVPCLIPWVNARHLEVAAVSLNIQRSDHFQSPFPHHNPNWRIACHGLYSTRKSEYPEKAAYFERIMALKDAPVISAEQMAERNKRSMQIANCNTTEDTKVSA